MHYGKLRPKNSNVKSVQWNVLVCNNAKQNIVVNTSEITDLDVQAKLKVYHSYHRLNYILIFLNLIIRTLLTFLTWRIYYWLILHAIIYWILN